MLWLRKNSIAAAFEVECTTAVYSGLLRMSDLLALQPDLDIKLYLVAPDERRGKVEQRSRARRSRSATAASGGVRVPLVYDACREGRGDSAAGTGVVFAARFP